MEEKGEVWTEESHPQIYSFCYHVPTVINVILTQLQFGHNDRDLLQSEDERATGHFLHIDIQPRTKSL